MKINNFIAILCFAIVFFLIKFTPLNATTPSVTNVTITIIIYVIGFIVALYYSYPILKNDWKEFKKQKWYKYLFITASFILMLIILKIVRYALTSIIPSQSITEDIDSINKSLPFYMIFMGSLPALLAPFFEELAFRNNLFYQLKNNLFISVVMAIISSILFGAIHYYNFNSFTATIPYMFIGLFFCMIYAFKRNIYYTIIPHLLLNWMNVFLGLIGYFLLQSNSI